MLAAAQITIRDENDVVIASAAPASPVVDMLWLDTSVTPNALKRWNGNAWVDCSEDVDLSAYYTRTEMDTRFEQTDAAIALKADKTTTDSLSTRIAQAEQKVTPEAITATVTSSALYAYEKYAGRNYCLNSGETHTFIGNKYQKPNGVMTTDHHTGTSNVSDDLFAAQRQRRGHPHLV